MKMAARRARIQIKPKIALRISKTSDLTEDASNKVSNENQKDGGGGDPIQCVSNKQSNIKPSIQRSAFSLRLKTGLRGSGAPCLHGSMDSVENIPISSVVGEPDPVAGELHPIVGEPHPLAGESHPVVEPYPLAGEPDSVAGELHPIVGELHPLAGELDPVAGESHPVVGEPYPLAGEPDHVAAELHPIVGEPHPLAGEPDPVAGESHPVVGEQYPVAGETDPVAGEPHLIDGEPHPVASELDPVAGETGTTINPDVQKQAVEMLNEIGELSCMMSLVSKNSPVSEDSPTNYTEASPPKSLSSKDGTKNIEIKKGETSTDEISNEQILVNTAALPETKEICPPLQSRKEDTSTNRLPVADTADAILESSTTSRNILGDSAPKETLNPTISRLSRFSLKPKVGPKVADKSSNSSTLVNSNVTSLDNTETSASSVTASKQNQEVEKNVDKELSSFVLDDQNNEVVTSKPTISRRSRFSVQPKVRPKVTGCIATNCSPSVKSSVPSLDSSQTVALPVTPAEQDQEVSVERGVVKELTSVVPKDVPEDSKKEADTLKPGPLRRSRFSVQPKDGPKIADHKTPSSSTPVKSSVTSLDSIETSASSVISGEQSQDVSLEQSFGKELISENSKNETETSKPVVSRRSRFSVQPKVGQRVTNHTTSSSTVKSVVTSLDSSSKNPAAPSEQDQEVSVEKSVDKELTPVVPKDVPENNMEEADSLEIVPSRCSQLTSCSTPVKSSISSLDSSDTSVAYVAPDEQKDEISTVKNDAKELTYVASKDVIEDSKKRADSSKPTITRRSRFSIQPKVSDTKTLSSSGSIDSTASSQDTSNTSLPPLKSDGKDQESSIVKNAEKELAAESPKDVPDCSKEPDTSKPAASRHSRYSVKPKVCPKVPDRKVIRPSPPVKSLIVTSLDTSETSTSSVTLVDKNQEVSVEKSIVKELTSIADKNISEDSKKEADSSKPAASRHSRYSVKPKVCPKVPDRKVIRPSPPVKSLIVTSLDTSETSTSSVTLVDKNQEVSVEKSIVKELTSIADKNISEDSKKEADSSKPAASRRSRYSVKPKVCPKVPDRKVIRPSPPVKSLIVTSLDPSETSTSSVTLVDKDQEVSVEKSIVKELTSIADKNISEDSKKEADSSKVTVSRSQFSVQTKVTDHNAPRPSIKSSVSSQDTDEKTSALSVTSNQGQEDSVVKSVDKELTPVVSEDVQKGVKEVATYSRKPAASRHSRFSIQPKVALKINDRKSPISGLPVVGTSETAAAAASVTSGEQNPESPTKNSVVKVVNNKLSSVVPKAVSKDSKEEADSGISATSRRSRFSIKPKIAPKVTDQKISNGSAPVKSSVPLSDTSEAAQPSVSSDNQNQKVSIEKNVDEELTSVVPKDSKMEVDTGEKISLPKCNRFKLKVSSNKSSDQLSSRFTNVKVKQSRPVTGSDTNEKTENKEEQQLTIAPIKDGGDQNDISSQSLIKKQSVLSARRSRFQVQPKSKDTNQPTHNSSQLKPEDQANASDQITDKGDKGASENIPSVSDKDKAPTFSRRSRFQVRPKLGMSKEPEKSIGHPENPEKTKSAAVEEQTAAPTSALTPSSEVTKGKKRDIGEKSSFTKLVSFEKDSSIAECTPPKVARNERSAVSSPKKSTTKNSPHQTPKDNGQFDSIKQKEYPVTLPKSTGKSRKILPLKEKQKKPDLTDHPADKPPDRAKMKMRDLIYWNPSSSPMKSPENKRTRPIKLGEETTPKIQEPPSNENEPFAVPQVKIGADGNIVVNEESLVINNTQPTAPISSEVVDETDVYSNYGSFRRYTPKSKWSLKDTKKFFLALSTVGTDFSLMTNLFPHKNRRDLKNKFKREERNNRWLVDKAIKQRLHFDEKLFEVQSESEEEEEKQAPPCKKSRQKKSQSEPKPKDTAAKKAKTVSAQSSHKGKKQKKVNNKDFIINSETVQLTTQVVEEEAVHDDMLIISENEPYCDDNSVCHDDNSTRSRSEDEDNSQDRGSKHPKKSLKKVQSNQEKAVVDTLMKMGQRGSANANGDTSLSLDVAANSKASASTMSTIAEEVTVIDDKIAKEHVTLGPHNMQTLVSNSTEDGKDRASLARLFLQQMGLNSQINTLQDEIVSITEAEISNDDRTQKVILVEVRPKNQKQTVVHMFLVSQADGLPSVPGTSQIIASEGQPLTNSQVSDIIPTLTVTTTTTAATCTQTECTPSNR